MNLWIDTVPVIQVNALLTVLAAPRMVTSGLKWKDLGNYESIFNRETRMDLSFNPVKYILRRKLVALPSTVWNYSPGDTQLLTEIIQRATGLTIAQFADQFLFRTLGIHQFEWVNLTFKHISVAASDLRLTSLDLLKFGALYSRWATGSAYRF